MDHDVIKKAEEIINAKTGYIGGGMEGYAALSLIDENGYPTASTLTIAKADGINWITFCTSLGRDYVKRIKKCECASVCINSSEYNITLVGTIEVLTDIETKKDNWMPIMDNGGHWSGPDDPEFCVLRFTTERYSLFVGYKEVKGSLKEVEKKIAPSIEPMFTFDRQCEQAIELYKKAFGARIISFMRYSDADPKDLPAKFDADKDLNLVYNAQIMIGNQRVMLCDNLYIKDLPRGNSVYPVMIVKTANEVKTAYDVLVDGATITTPIGSTTYSESCVSLVDKFGIHWDLMVY